MEATYHAITTHRTCLEMCCYGIDLSANQSTVYLTDLDQWDCSGPECSWDVRWSRFQTVSESRNCWRFHRSSWANSRDFLWSHQTSVWQIVWTLHSWWRRLAEVPDTKRSWIPWRILFFLPSSQNRSHSSVKTKHCIKRKKHSPLRGYPRCGHYQMTPPLQNAKLPQYWEQSYRFEETELSS